MAKQIKTNAMRIIDKYKVEYESYEYEVDDKMDGVDIAILNHLNPNRVFKTLVTQGVSKEYYVFMVPVNKELNLKKAAIATSEKKVEMIPQKNLLNLTGYIHGGCSPLGMKKQFKTYIHSTINEDDYIVFSGGKRGIQLKLSVSDFMKVSTISVVDICD